MNLEGKKRALMELGQFFNNTIEQYKGNLISTENSKVNLLQTEMTAAIDRVKNENGWFIPYSVLLAMQAWADSLQKQKIDTWLKSYTFTQFEPKKVGLIMAGNIPFVGLHDVLCVLISGHKLYAKVSSKDKTLMLLVLNVLKQLSKEWDEKIVFADRLNEIDVLIATGSDNSARYFDYYFKDKKRLIRKNRTSIAVLDGNETEEELEGLSRDIFTHFGLGCRNVTKVFVPEGYKLDKIFAALYAHKELANHNKYSNNYDYNKAVYLLNKVDLIENGFVLLKEDGGIHSPVAVLFYEYYKELDELRKVIKDKEESIQCVVGGKQLENAIPFGKAQSPELWDYADGVDTLQFLLEANN